MMRSNRPSAAATARKSHASRTPCEHQFRRAHGMCETCDFRTAAAADGCFDCIIASRFANAAQ
eukprot:9611751-Lingulodinium_polyedra.AAC.1